MIFNQKKLFLSVLSLLYMSLSWAQGNSSESQAKSPLIREYKKESDEAAVSAILDQCPQYLRYESLGLPQGTTEKYINSPKYITRVLEEDQKVVGFINFTKIDRKLWFLNFGSTGLIHLIGVDESAQGKHYGKILFQHAIAALLEEGISQFFLTVKVDNQKARSLYEKLGFQLMFVAGNDCFYVANFANPKASKPTLEEKVLKYSLQHPIQTLVALAVGGYLTYKGFKRFRSFLSK